MRADTNNGNQQKHLHEKKTLSQAKKNKVRDDVHDEQQSEQTIY